ncbi:MAG: hypothetical protein WBB74_10385 [Gaiellaceae bacterium]
MCGHRSHHRHGRRRFPNPEEWLRRLEERQRDLEEEAADIAELIRRLREQQPQQTATV